MTLGMGAGGGSLPTRRATSTVLMRAAAVIAGSVVAMAAGAWSTAFVLGAARSGLSLKSDSAAGDRRHAVGKVACRAAKARRAPLVRKTPKSGKDMPPMGCPPEADQDEYTHGNYKFEYGWSSEKRKFIDMPDVVTRWWQRPGYLTPDGYKFPPHWDMETYKLAVKETAYAKLEAQLIKDLEEQGWSWREIRDRASVYEILEDDDSQMTDKMKFLLQVQALWMGVEDDLLDFREKPDKPPPRQAKKVQMKPRSA